MLAEKAVLGGAEEISGFAYAGGMPKLTSAVKSLFRRRRPVTRADAAEIADWVNEGGALHPAGPPPIVDPDATKRRRKRKRR